MGLRRNQVFLAATFCGSALLASGPAAAQVDSTFQFSAANYSVTEGTATLTIKVTRKGGINLPASVNYSSGGGTATAGSDYSKVSGKLSWATGDNKLKSFKIRITNDTAAESTETLQLTLSGASGGKLGTPAVATVSIKDNDVATPPPPTPVQLSFGSATYSASESLPVLNVTVQRSGGTGAASVHYATANGSALAGSDYTAASGDLSWVAGDTAAKIITLSLFDDATVESAESFSIALSSPAGATLAAPSTATINVADNDAPPPSGGNPILFVTQVPVSGFLIVSSPFGAQEGYSYKAPRGGDLMIRYADGTLRNLTAEAGYGVATGFQGANAIAVRQPTVHWSGAKAIFSMVVGGNTQQYQTNNAKWQLYEVTNLAKGQTAVITKVPGQPTDYNNIAPVYASDGQIIYVSDRPRGGQAHLYPQRDEYESANVDTGLWKLNPATQTYKLIEHAPSGVTYPSIDNAGRVIFTKWDHLQRDQQADADAFSAPDAYKYGAFNYDSEEQTAVPGTWSIQEFFPELRRAVYSRPYGSGYDGTSIDPAYPYADHTFNHFFPWMLNQDGTEEETLNHVGRHELGGTYSVGSFRADGKLRDTSIKGQFNGASYFLRGDGGMFHLREDPLHPGTFYGTDAPEFSTNTAGSIIRVGDGSVGSNPDGIKVDMVIDRSGIGRMRNPTPLTDGGLLVVHTTTEDNETNTGTSTAPSFNYAFRLRSTKVVSGKRVPDAYLTGGISKTINWWSPDQKVNWSGTLWELDPVEVVARAVPPKTQKPALPSPEQQAFDEAGVSHELLSNWLHKNNLALAVSRNVTTRDRSDQQQPFNLRVPSGAVNTPTAGATIYDITRQQFFQGDQIRGYASGKPPQQGGSPSAGRRVIAVPMHDTAAMGANLAVPAGQSKGSVPIAADGSTAAFVPAKRALAWQLVDGSGKAIVRERNWLSFAPGETRVCASCHGVNTLDQAGHAAPVNKPQALVGLLQNWKQVVRNQCAASGGTGTWSYSGVALSACDEGKQYRIQVCSGGNSCCNGLPATETLSCGP